MFRSSFFSTKYTSLGANLPPTCKSFSQTAAWYFVEEQGNSVHRVRQWRVFELCGGNLCNVILAGHEIHKSRYWLICHKETSSTASQYHSTNTIYASWYSPIQSLFNKAPLPKSVGSPCKDIQLNRTHTSWCRTVWLIWWSVILHH